MPIRIVTWNVNGIRNPFKYAPWNKDRTLQNMFDTLEADIVCFQEVKTPKSSLTDDLVFVDGWDTFYSFPHSQTGYSGVSVYTRDSKCAPIRVEEGVVGVLRAPGTRTRYVDRPPADQIGGYPSRRQLRQAAVSRDVLDAIDTEGRCLLLEFPLFVLVNVYCPARRNEERTGFRSAFFVALDARVRNLAAAGKNVVLVGDMNTMRDHLDTATVWGHHGQKSAAEALAFDEDYLPLHTVRVFNQLLFHGRLPAEPAEPAGPPVLYDACRERHPERGGMYTCWDTKKNHRPANFGSRIDFILCSPKLMTHLVTEADIQPQLLGSDHCPVYVVLRDSLEDGGDGQLFTLDYLNPRGRFVRGEPVLSPGEEAPVRKRLPQSARRMPLFANRQHIGNLFRRPAKTATEEKEGSSVDSLSQQTADSEQDSQWELPALLRADPVPVASLPDDDSEEDDPPDESVPKSGSSSQAEATPRPTGLFAGVSSEPSQQQPVLRKPMPLAKPPATPPRSKKAAARTVSASSAAGTSRPTKKPKTGIQTSISMFLQPQNRKTASEDKQEESKPAVAEEPEEQGHPPSDEASTDAAAANSDAFWAEINDAAVTEWSRMGLGQRKVPLCEHGEPCKVFVTRKPGVNNGRSFYMCARPPGPLGRREKGTAWQCTTFVWCRDWKPGQE